MIPSGARVLVASQPVDFRKGPDGLLALVRDAGADPFSGALYVFRAKRADRIKIVWWDGTGLCLYAKRLEKATFCWPRIGDNRVQLNHAQLMALVDGMFAGLSGVAMYIIINVSGGGYLVILTAPLQIPTTCSWTG